MLDVLRAKLQPGSSYSQASSLAAASKRKWGQLQVGSTLCDRDECASVFLKRCWACSSVTDESRRRMTQRLSVVAHDHEWGNIPEGTYLCSALTCAYTTLEARLRAANRNPSVLQSPVKVARRGLQTLLSPNNSHVAEAIAHRLAPCCACTHDILVDERCREMRDDTEVAFAVELFRNKAETDGGVHANRGTENIQIGAKLCNACRCAFYTALRNVPSGCAIQHYSTRWEHKGDRMHTVGMNVHNVNAWVREECGDTRIVIKQVTQPHLQ